MIAVAIMTLLFQMACNYDDAHPKAKEATATAVPNVTNSVAIERDPNGQLPNIADIVEQVRGSVVSIVAQVVTHDRFGRRASDFGSGTGVIFDESGLVLTNNHVIENGVQVIVTLDNGDQV